MSRWNLHGVTAVLAATMCFASAVQAQATRPIRIVSQFATGSVSDLTLRVVGERLGVRLKTSVIIENMPTGGGVAAARAVINSPADGNTLALLSNATAVSVVSFENLPFDPVRDFVPVAGISQFGYIFLANEKSAIRSFREFVAAARAKPGVLNVGTAAPGTTPYLIAQLLKKEANIEFTMIPYRGATELTVALLRNDIDMFINAYGAVKEHIRQKQMKVLASTSADRFKLLPEVPTVQEEGVRGFEATSWNGLFAPTGSPAGVVSRIGVQLRGTLAEPEVSKKLLDLGIEVWSSDAPELAARMRAEIERWRGVVQEAALERN